MTNRAPDVSVVVPLFNEEPCVQPLVESVRAALDPDYDWELVLVDDGSSDRTADRAREHAHLDTRVRVIQLTRNCGQTIAMQAGFDHARGETIVSMDGDLQNDPRDIPRLLDELARGYDLVAGYREARRDAFLTRKVPSWIANRMIRRLTGVPIRDNGCSLKAYRSVLLDRLRLYSEMHRFIPAVAAGTAGARIVEIPVRHHPRAYGKSKYGLSRIWKVLADLLTITMIRWFRERPLLMFGYGALASLATAGVLGVAGIVLRFLYSGTKASALVLPGAALLFLGLAFYLMMLGLIGEEVLRSHEEANTAIVIAHRTGVEK